MREHIDALVEKVDESQLRFGTTAVICLFLGGGLYLNTDYQWLNPWTVMNILLVVFSLSFFRGRVPRMQPSFKKVADEVSGEG